MYAVLAQPMFPVSVENTKRLAGALACKKKSKMSVIPEYYQRLACAYIRGKLGPGIAGDEASRGLFDCPLDALSQEEMQALIRLGVEAGLRLHRFKRTMALARVQKVLGILKGLHPASLLDIGSGRGAFLWPLLDAFPALPVTMLDLLDYRVADIQAVQAGGIERLSASQMDVTALGFADRSFDVVTMLEVLEHIPAAEKALAEVCRVARRCLIVSVPSRPDDNPEHLHLFSEQRLRALLASQGVRQVNASYVLNHIVMVATVGT